MYIKKRDLSHEEQYNSSVSILNNYHNDNKFIHPIPQIKMKKFYIYNDNGFIQLLFEKERVLIINLSYVIYLFIPPKEG